LNKAPDAFRTISEVAEELDLPQHVLRFWESRFAQIKPMKRGGGRRFYRPDDVDLLRGIRHLLYREGYTIRGVQRILRDPGPKFVQGVWREGAAPPPARAGDLDDSPVTGSTLRHGAFGLSAGRSADDGSRTPETGTVEESRDREAEHATWPGTDPAGYQPMSAISPLPDESNTRIPHESLERLHAVLSNLLECKRLLKGIETPLNTQATG
jgi:DNA-binding transcriptional MerR regulator